MKVKVRIQRVETYNLDVEVEAASVRDAIKTVRERYYEDEYDSMLDSMDDVEAHFYCPEGEVTK
jgi:predicted DNA-binding protein (UPF0278 family)